MCYKLVSLQTKLHRAKATLAANEIMYDASGPIKNDRTLMHFEHQLQPSGEVYALGNSYDVAHSAQAVEVSTKLVP
jgi:hypothetical protein